MQPTGRRGRGAAPGRHPPGAPLRNERLCGREHDGPQLMRQSLGSRASPSAGETMTEPKRKERPFDFFRLRALTLAPRLGVDPAQAAEMVGVLATAFGEEWLNQAAEDFSPSAALAFRRHPLGNLISTAGETQLAEALELVEYLVRVRDAPRLTDVLNGLKGYYHSALVQLSTGARLSIAGATDVAFEPPAEANRASDIHCRMEDAETRVECYRTTSRLVQSDEHTRLAFRLLDLVSGEERAFAIAVALRVPLTAALRKEIARVVSDGVAQVRQRIGAGREAFPGTLLTSEDATISIAAALPVQAGSPPILLRPPDFPFQDDDWDAYVRASRAPVEMLTHVGTPPVQGTGLSSVGIWLPPAERQVTPTMSIEERVQQLGRKIEAKLAQARNRGKAVRVVLVQTPVTTLVREQPVLLERLRGKIVTSRPDVAALVLQRRSWREDLGRHGHEVVLALNDGTDQGVIGVLRRYAEIDVATP